MSQVLDDSLEAGREAARRRAWRDAYELLGKANEDGLLGAEDLEQLAEAAWWTGHLDEAIDLRERAYAAYVEAGEPRRAALLAMMISSDHGKKGSGSVAGGWLARAARLLENEPEGVEHGHLALAQGTGAVMMGQIEPARGAPCARPRARHALRRSEPRSDGDGLPGDDARHVRPGERGSRAARRGDGRRGGRRARAARDRDGLLRDHPLVPDARRLRAGRRVDDRSESLVRQARRERLPRRLPRTPGGDHAAPGQLGPRRRAGDPGVRRARRLLQPHHVRGLPRDRRDPAPTWRLRTGGGGLPEGERARPPHRRSARPRAPAPGAGKGRLCGRRDQARARERGA